MLRVAPAGPFQRSSNCDTLAKDLVEIIWNSERQRKSALAVTYTPLAIDYRSRFVDKKNYGLPAEILI